MYYTNLFFIFSVIGYIIENIFGTFKGSGILFGPWTPVYGQGVVIVIHIYSYFNKKKELTGIKKIILSFLIGFIVLTVMEYIGGYLIERLLRTTYWDYSNQRFNIGKYTSLRMAFIWGLSSTFIVFIIKPISRKITSFIPRVISYTLITIFYIDIILSLSTYLIK